MIAQIVAQRCSSSRAVAGPGTGSSRRTGESASCRPRSLTIRPGSAWSWSHDREELQHEVMAWVAQVISGPFDEPWWDV
jgi:hypothetical protein